MTYKIILATGFLFISTNSPALVSDYDYRRILEERCRVIINSPNNPLTSAEITELRWDIFLEMEHSETNQEYDALQELIDNLSNYSQNLQRHQPNGYIAPQNRSRKTKDADSSTARKIHSN